MTETPHTQSRRILGSRSLQLWSVGFIALIALLVWGLLMELPTGPQSGLQLSGPADRLIKLSPRIRVGTFNIHGGTGRDGRFDLARTAAALKDLDFVGLNEVHSQPFVESNQAELLGRQLEMPWLFAPTEYCWRGEHFGSAVLSRLPVDHWQRIPLEHRTAVGYRNLILLNIPLEKGNLKVIVTHADRTTDRPHQLQAIFSLFNSLSKPALLMGDLNTRRADPLLAPHLDSGNWTDCVGPHLSEDPPNRIDWILARGLKSVAAGRIDNGASDHPCLWAELDLAPYLESP